MISRTVALLGFLLVLSLSLALGLPQGPALIQAKGESIPQLLEEAGAQSPLLLQQLFLASLMVLACLAIQLLLTALILHQFRSRRLLRWAARRSSRRVLLVAGMALAVFLAMILDILLWALFYLRHGAIQDFATALYFSCVVFTSLGYGDVLLSPYFRLLGPLEALVGLLMSGWGTALLVTVTHRMIQPSLGEDSSDEASSS